MGDKDREPEARGGREEPGRKGGGPGGRGDGGWRSGPPGGPAELKETKEGRKGKPPPAAVLPAPTRLKIGCVVKGRQNESSRLKGG